MSKFQNLRIMKKLILFVLVALPFACVNDNIDAEKYRSGNYVVFGNYHGMCAVQCVRMYLLNENSLFEDTNKRLPSTLKPYEGNFSVDRGSRLDDVKDILTQIPEALVKSEENVLGCPDCSDGGGLYIETKIDGEIRFWFIDKQRMPAGLEDFITLVNEKLLLLE